MKKHILCINGPNLNLLGERETHVYGTQSLENIAETMTKTAQQQNTQLSFFQDNCEGNIVNRIQQSKEDSVDFLILNLAAYTHTSIAILDALRFVRIPYIEVHLSNVYARDAFRHKSMIAFEAVGVICGFRANSYHLALKAALDHLSVTPKS